MKSVAICTALQTKMLEMTYCLGDHLSMSEVVETSAFFYMDEKNNFRVPLFVIF